MSVWSAEAEAGDTVAIKAVRAFVPTADGACAIDVPLAGVSTVRGLLEAVVHLGQAMVDADVSAATIKVHYALGAGEKRRSVLDMLGAKRQA